MQKQQSKNSLENHRLKDIFPQVQQRKTYAENKLSKCLLKQPVIVRIQANNSTELPTIYITRLMEKSTKMGVINSLVFNILKLTNKDSVYLFIDNKITSNELTVGQIYDQKKQQDGILYIKYGGQPTF